MRVAGGQKNGGSSFHHANYRWNGDFMANTLLWLSALLVASSGQLPSAVSPAIDEVSPQLLKHTPQTAPGKSGIEKNGIENCCAIDSSETASSRAPA
ncbi:MAG: hypothetical protein RJP95_00820, partial [Pirellulales bacterium]